MSLKEDLLDFETPIRRSFLNKLEAKPSYLKILGILLISILSALIIYYKANPTKDHILGVLGMRNK